ncbi:CHAT domain-containing protein [Roridomyces roridus]|uniref:CHAT domain-containing protein n=1 Tax=Roridomyces roridus TaxID=1738132 RepID=A0AAD7B7R0_9AGAR|nr:CHAT domain-containing protein [Roridomyces roridus]
MREDAVHLTREGHPYRASFLKNLGNSLIARFQQLGSLQDLQSSVSAFDNALHITPEGHPDKASTLSNLGSSLIRQFQHLGRMEDLQRSVSLLEDAVHLTPEGHPDKAFRLTNLGISLIARFQQLGSLEDLHKSVSDAVRLTPDGHSDKPSRLTTLGGLLMIQFEQLGNPEDLHKSVSVCEDAVHLTLEGHSDRASRDPDKAYMLSNLGSSLMTRFQQLGSLEDLHSSVSVLDNVLHVTPDGHPDKASRLNNLGSSLIRRFQHLGSLEDLQRSVSVLEDAVHLIAEGDPDKASMLSNLGSSLIARFQQLGSLEDLHSSVSVLDNALHITPEGHPDKASRFHNLGSSLMQRFQHLGTVEDLQRSVSLLEDAVRLIPDGHPDKVSMLNNLGNSLMNRFEQFHDYSALGHATTLYSSAACSPTGSANVRFNSASNWALSCIKLGESPLKAYQVALDLLPELAWLGLPIPDRHHHLKSAGEIVRNAAASALAADQPEKAVEWLEQGRSVIWGQLLNLRTPMDALMERDPRRANELLSLSSQLERLGNTQSPSSGTQPSPQSIAAQAYHAAERRQKLIQEIWQLEGFERFLMPKTISELSSAAQGGPVVIINVTDTGGDAVVLLHGLHNKVIHIPLQHLNQDLNAPVGLSTSLRDLVGRNIRLLAKKEGQKTTENGLKDILSTLWVGIVKPVLDGLAFNSLPKTANKPRIWWCLTGPLVFLPIHAAGIYGSNKSTIGSKVSDYVISSYTPSLTALIEGYCRDPVLHKGLQVLAVAQPVASGQTHIPGTKAEINHIQHLAQTRRIPLVTLYENMATIERVQEEMQKSQWAHFACHGVQDVTTPTASALLLAGDSRLTLANIIQLALPHADFAFLSACQTATGDEKLQEESVHLAAGMLLAGYRGVIATMWTITDQDAPQVAKDVYEYLLQTSPPDATKAAAALHFAIEKLQERYPEKSLLHWVPYVHIGI